MKIFLIEFVFFKKLRIGSIAFLKKISTENDKECKDNLKIIFTLKNT